MWHLYLSSLYAVKSFQDHFKGVVDNYGKCHFTTCRVGLLHFWKMKFLLMQKVDSSPVSPSVLQTLTAVFNEEPVTAELKITIQNKTSCELRPAKLTAVRLKGFTYPRAAGALTMSIPAPSCCPSSVPQMGLEEAFTRWCWVCWDFCPCEFWSRFTTKKFT